MDRNPGAPCGSRRGRDDQPRPPPIRPIVHAASLGYGRATKGSNGQSERGVGKSRDTAGQPVGEPGPEGGPDRWIGIEAAALHLDIPTRTMYRLAQRHKVPAVKVGRTWRFRSSALDAHLERSMMARAPDDPAPAWTVSPMARPVLLGSLARDGWGEISGELATLAGPREIARYLEGRLRQIYHVDVVGLLRVEDDELVTIVESDELGVPTGARFVLEPSSRLLAAIRHDEPCVIEDLAADPTYQSDPLPRLCPDPVRRPDLGCPCARQLHTPIDPG